MRELESQLITEDRRPADLTVTSAKPDRWYQSEAIANGFKDLLPDDFHEYSVAVGYNSSGEIVGAAKIGLYIRKGAAHRAVLREQANTVFGLTSDPIPPSAKQAFEQSLSGD